MQAVQAMTGHGGWPMTVFLTPEGVPFYGGTYFPNDDRHGMPSFTRILAVVSRTRIARSRATSRAPRRPSARCTTRPRRKRAAPVRSRRELLDRAYRALARALRRTQRRIRRRAEVSADDVARLPAPILGAHAASSEALAMVTHSFKQMARGGIYDQVGGGFARYAVDAIWLVPHFEKMLYDNALLVRLGAHLWQATKDDEVRRVVEETIDWATREMRVARGRILLVARRGQRRPRGQVLRLDRRRNRLASSATTRRSRARTGASRRTATSRDDNILFVGGTVARSPRGFR